MKWNITFYYVTVCVFFVLILLSVRHIVNTNRVIISSVEAINPTEIFWELDDEDTLIRIKDPLYLPSTFYLCERQAVKYKKDSDFLNQLYGDSIAKKGSIINLKPPYVLWKSANNDTIKVYKDSKTLNFVKRI